MAALRICFIGDSLVTGTGDAEFLGWTGRVCALARGRGHDITCYNLGVRGNTSGDIVARWWREADARIAAGEDCRLVFAFGVNDTKDADGKRIVEPMQTIVHAREILGNAVAWLPTLMIGPPPIADTERSERIAELSRRLEMLAAKIAVPYLASFDLLTASPVWRDALAAGDGVHPVAAGYAEWARLIDAWPAWRAWAR